MKERGFSVFVNLWHFTLPAWVAAEGGWESPEIMKYWYNYVSQAARRLGHAVDWWSTMIDSQIYALRAYLLAEFPPMVANGTRAINVMKILAKAHLLGREVIKLNSPKKENARVGQIYFFTIYESGGNFFDNLVTRILNSIFNIVMIDALVYGHFSALIPGIKKVDIDIPDLKNSLDWLGINYYSREIVYFDAFSPGLVKRTSAKGSNRTMMGWEIYPKGIYDTCIFLANRYPGLPLIITENGMPDTEDEKRPVFIVEHLEWLLKAIEDGAPVSGYMYWSLTDNLEWLDGFKPKFGLYSIDRNTMERQRTNSAKLFSYIAQTLYLPGTKELDGIFKKMNPDYFIRKNIKPDELLVI